MNFELNLTCTERRIETSVFDGVDFSVTAVTRIIFECINDEPQLFLDADNNQKNISVSFTEGSAVPVQLFSTLFLRDIDSGFWNYAEVSLVNSLQTNEGTQVCLFRICVILYYYYSGIGITISLEKTVNKSGAALISEYARFLETTLFYFSTEDELVGDDRLVSVFVVDLEGAQSETVYANIELIHVCDYPPVPENLTYYPQIREDVSNGVLVQRIEFTDADLGPPNRVTCQVSGNSDPGVVFSTQQAGDLSCDVLATSTNSSFLFPFDYERETLYSLTVIATGVQCLQAEVTIVLEVSSPRDFNLL